MRLLFTKRPAGVFAPADAQAEEWARTVKAGEELFLEPRRARNPKHHRKAFSLFQFVLDSSDRFSNIDQVLFWLKVQTGHYQEFIRETGEIVYETKSISWAAMPQDDFNDWFQKALEVIRRELLPTMSDSEVEAALAYYGSI